MTPKGPRLALIGLTAITLSLGMFKCNVREMIDFAQTLTDRPDPNLNPRFDGRRLTREGLTKQIYEPTSLPSELRQRIEGQQPSQRER